MFGPVPAPGDVARAAALHRRPAHRGGLPCRTSTPSSSRTTTTITWDHGSILKLKDRTDAFSCRWRGCAPAGLGVPEERIHELDWWQETTYQGLDLAFAPPAILRPGPHGPLQHAVGFGRIKGRTGSIYFSGDGGYGPHFAEIGSATIPSTWRDGGGQYNELWAQIHMMPEETARAAMDVRAKHLRPSTGALSRWPCTPGPTRGAWWPRRRNGGAHHHAAYREVLTGGNTGPRALVGRPHPFPASGKGFPRVGLSLMFTGTSRPHPPTMSQSRVRPRLREQPTLIAENTAKDADFFAHLERRPEPEILYIGCSDSRVTAEELMGVRPGMPSYTGTSPTWWGGSDLNALSDRIRGGPPEGEARGGLRPLLLRRREGGDDRAGPRPVEPLAAQHPRRAYRLHRKELDAITEEEARYKRLVELNVEEQCLNASRPPWCRRATWPAARPPCMAGCSTSVRAGRRPEDRLRVEAEGHPCDRRPGRCPVRWLSPMFVRKNLTFRSILVFPAGTWSGWCSGACWSLALYEYAGPSGCPFPGCRWP